MPLNNNFGQLCSEPNQRPDFTPKQEPVKVNKKTLAHGMKTVKRYQQRHQKMSRWCSGGSIANPKRAPHTAPVPHSSTPSRQMLKMLASCKGSEIYPKVIEKKPQHSTNTRLPSLNKIPNC